MDPKIVNRINELYKKSKTVGLTAEESQEQQILKKKYIEAFKGNLQSTLDSIVIVDKDGKQRILRKQ